MVTEILDIQKVRLIDIFIIAPILIYSSSKVENEYLKLILLLIGIFTALYNAENYYKNV